LQADISQLTLMLSPARAVRTFSFVLQLRMVL